MLTFIHSISVLGAFDIFFLLLVLLGVAGETDWAARRFVSDNLNDLMPVESRRQRFKAVFAFLVIVGLTGELCRLPFSLIESARLNKQAEELRYLHTHYPDGVLTAEVINPSILTNPVVTEVTFRCTNGVPYEHYFDVFTKDGKGVGPLAIHLRGQIHNPTTDPEPLRFRVSIDTNALVDGVCEIRFFRKSIFADERLHGNGMTETIKLVIP